MNSYPSAMQFAAMTKVAPLQPATKFGPTVTAAQARAAQMTPEQREAMTTKIAKTAQTFEAQFVGQMMGEMYEGVDLGGAEAFKSVMMDAVGKKIAASGGIGLAKQVQTEMLKLQGLN